MKIPKRVALIGACGAALAAIAVGTVASAAGDFGLFVQNQVESHSQQLFGISNGLPASSQSTITAAQANADPTKLVTLAKPLKARVVTTQVGVNADQMALWPNDTNPKYLIVCDEEGTAQPGLQRVRLSDGQTDTIVTGTTSCDPVRRTPWGTILFGEEAGGGASGGAMYELINPLATTGVTLNRATGTFSGGTGAANLVRRDALGRLSFEGLAIYPNGVVYYGDENRPGNGAAGGAYFKFIPTAGPGANAANDLTQSPLASGSVYGLRLGLRSGGTDYGQATETGEGQWLLVASAPNADLRSLSATNHLTGYYRPEDIDIDRTAQAAGNVRFCGTNTGNEVDDHSYGEVVCITDGTVAGSTSNVAIPTLYRLVQGNPQFAMPDNVAFKPGDTPFWVFHEDGDMLTGNNDLWACVDDGSDFDLQADGCIRIATLNDKADPIVHPEGAEWTGGIFDASGTHFYVSVQHNVSGHGLILDITGWKGSHGDDDH